MANSQYMIGGNIQSSPYHLLYECVSTHKGTSGQNILHASTRAIWRTTCALQPDEFPCASFAQVWATRLNTQDETNPSHYMNQILHLIMFTHTESRGWEPTHRSLCQNCASVTAKQITHFLYFCIEPLYTFSDAFILTDSIREFQKGLCIVHCS